MATPPVAWRAPARIQAHPPSLHACLTAHSLSLLPHAVTLRQLSLDLAAGPLAPDLLPPPTLRPMATLQTTNNPPRRCLSEIHSSLLVLNLPPQQTKEPTRKPPTHVSSRPSGESWFTRTPRAVAPAAMKEGRHRVGKNKVRGTANAPHPGPVSGMRARNGLARARRVPGPAASVQGSAAARQKQNGAHWLPQPGGAGNCGAGTCSCCRASSCGADCG